MNITIREIKADDFTGLISLFTEFATFEKTLEKMTNTVDRMTVEQEFFNGFVALNDSEEIVGYVTHFFAYYTWIGKSLYMDDLYVKEEFRGHGIGTELINKVIEYAKTTNCQKVKWQVSEWNKPAIEFYKSLGASIDSVESNCDLLL
ncbi:GNAT family N-acetyltransferase [Geofilum rhodophaeum]|uniref:GNAT family N-acetyltransferase n=1 Tax=Geofilum rhodophaeum TaxID=1965019 RepID=UPI000B520F89|nr:GNAT family N-acetyltransferase [Geofilum rhodophaeum]